MYLTVLMPSRGGTLSELERPGQLHFCHAVQEDEIRAFYWMYLNIVHFVIAVEW